MKITTLGQPPIFDRATLSTQPGRSFEDIFDLASALKVRQESDRAFAFTERGMLSLADPSEPAPDGRLATPPVIGPPARGQQLQIPSPSHGAEAMQAAAPTGLARTSEPASRPQIVKMVPDAPLATVSSPAPMTAARPPSLAEGEAEPDLAVGRLRLQGEASSPDGDLKLFVQWTREGVVVFATAAITSPEDLHRLRTQAEAIARDHGTTLAGLHLNGEPVAPQPLFRRT